MTTMVKAAKEMSILRRRLSLCHRARRRLVTSRLGGAFPFLAKSSSVFALMVGI